MQHTGETVCLILAHTNIHIFMRIQVTWCQCTCSVRTVLLSIQSLLGEPNNDSPLNSYAAKLWDNQEEYKRVLTKKYAEAQK